MDSGRDLISRHPPDIAPDIAQNITETLRKDFAEFRASFDSVAPPQNVASIEEQVRILSGEIAKKNVGRRQQPMIGDVDVPEEFPKAREESDRKQAPAELRPLLLDKSDRPPEQSRAESARIGDFAFVADLYARRRHGVQADLYLSLA